MKLNRLTVLLVVLALVPVAAFAQETGGEAFLLELSTQLAELGWDDDALAIQERAQIARALATHTAEMTRLGYAERDIAEAAMQATPAAAREMADQIHRVPVTRLDQETARRTALEIRVGQTTRLLS
ncbi:MAG: hypothetical protein KAU31_14620 [Spirochaetaceae bacterium]|nr:hypothetical protein [Spirochaetaceae bacterium]